MSLFASSPRYDRGVKLALLALLLVPALGACDGELRFSADPVEDAASETTDASVSDTGDTGGGPDGSSGGCTRDADCPFTTLHCDLSSGSCVPCLEDDHCKSGDLHRCDLASHRCVECGVSTDCDSSEVCDPLTRSCRRRCGADAGTCSGSMPICDTTRSYCVCNSESCESSERRHCSPTSRACVECRDDFDCILGDDRHCLEGACVRCTADSQCGSKRCEPTTHQCVE